MQRTKAPTFACTAAFPEPEEAGVAQELKKPLALKSSAFGIKGRTKLPKQIAYGIGTSHRVFSVTGTSQP